MERIHGRMLQGHGFRDEGRKFSWQKRALGLTILLVGSVLRRIDITQRYFYSQGGNFIDSANAYRNGESEEWIGDWMEARGARDQIVLATKYTNQLMAHLAGGKGVQLSNYGRNSTKSLYTSFEASLKKLKTTYIDIVRASSRPST